MDSLRRRMRKGSLLSQPLLPPLPTLPQSLLIRRGLRVANSLRRASKFFRRIFSSRRSRDDGEEEEVDVVLVLVLVLVLVDDGTTGHEAVLVRDESDAARKRRKGNRLDESCE